jgi:hypothetical protein
VSEKSSSERLRREAEKLREKAVRLMKQAEALIAKSSELDKEIARIGRIATKQDRKQ